MNHENQPKRDSLGLDEAINRVMSSDAPVHLGKAFREVLLAMRSAIDAVIEKKAHKSEVKIQKVIIE